VRIADYLRNPRAIAHRVARAVYERRHPGEPWIAPGAVRYLQDNLRTDMRALEWGSGRSTAWLAARVGHLVSVEHDAGWHARVAEDLRAGGHANVDYRLVPLDPDKPNGDIFTDDLPAYAGVARALDDASLDFVSVDGAYRVSCVLAALDKIKPGGLLMVDDSSWFPTLFDGHVPASWPIEFRPARGISATVIWRKP
jgi:predicted O-methyltransferase YrrM